MLDKKHPKLTPAIPREYPKTWRGLLPQVSKDEVELAEHYVGNYNRGTDGHRAKNTIAWLAQALDDLEAAGVDVVKLLDP